ESGTGNESGALAGVAAGGAGADGGRLGVVEGSGTGTGVGATRTRDSSSGPTSAAGSTARADVVATSTTVTVRRECSGCSSHDAVPAQARKAVAAATRTPSGRLAKRRRRSASSAERLATFGSSG